MSAVKSPLLAAAKLSSRSFDGVPVEVSTGELKVLGLDDLGVPGPPELDDREFCRRSIHFGFGIRRSEPTAPSETSELWLIAAGSEADAPE